MTPPGRAPWLLCLIALGKLLKCGLLVILGIEVLRLGGPHGPALLEQWARAIRVDPRNHYVHALLEHILAVDPGRLQQFSVGTFVYAGLYGVEGVGLWLDKTWAEWLTILTTAGFVPLEIYQLTRRLTVPRGVILMVNVAILGYLIHRLWQKHRRRKEGAGAEG